MIRLQGFATSNYYNKVKLVLLEKGVAFEEVLNWARKDEPTLALSPLGKVPFVMTEHGPLCESQVIADYLEAAYPEPALVPPEPYAAAKVRELITFLELHLELVARRLYPQAFFGKVVDDQTIEATRAELSRNVAAFARLARFAPFVASDRLTLADCAAVVHLPVIALATRIVCGADALEALPVKPYLAMMKERASVQRVEADRKQNLKLLADRNA